MSEQQENKQNIKQKRVTTMKLKNKKFYFKTQDPYYVILETEINIL